MIPFKLQQQHNEGAHTLYEHSQEEDQHEIDINLSASLFNISPISNITTSTATSTSTEDLSL
jgi:hypothetical protein